PDSMTITTFRSLMGSKPSLTLELDGHTADAGINTRIDAALDIIKNYRKINRNNNIPEENEFTPATIRLEGGKSCFVSSDGDIVPLNDKRVKILIPSMGDLSAALFAASFRSYGINAIQMPEGSPEILKYARANATGKECLPLLLCAGSLIYYIENEWNGKDYIASFIIQGAGNCRVGQYPVFLREMINRKKIRNVATLALSNEDAFAGMGAHLDLRLIQVILAADVLEDIRTAIMANAAEPEKGLEIFKEEYSKLVLDAEKQPEKFFKALKKFSKAIKEKVPAKINIKDSKYIALVGEIYVRREHFSHKWLNKYFAKKGFILKEAHISEWIFYVDYLIEKGLLEPDKSRKNRRDRFIRKKYMHYAEWRIKSILSRSGYYKYSKIDIEPLLNHSKHIIPLEYKGEPGLTLGVTMHEVIEKYCGIINLGPFGCMPTRFAESVCIPETKIENKIYAKRLNNPNYSLPAIFNDKMTLPFLTIETDGNVFPQVIEARLETFTLQAERIAKLVDEMKLNGNSTFKN
ncbi:MAG: hypothetical protein QG635_990, partial [Bacteroidota bacterium]|nr:hypothetical protein [Bacteroidota bacterium]